MKISLVIPTYNRAHLITESIESVIRQTYIDWECIIVDDGSTDNTKEVIEAFIKKNKNIFYFERPSSLLKGANSCRNLGYQVAKGDLINWLDSDDILDENHFLTHVNSHKKKLDLCASVSSAKIFNFKINDLDTKWSNIKPVNDVFSEMISGKISWPTPGVMWTKNCISNDLFNEKLQSSQEWTFHVLKLMDNLNFEIIDSTTIYVRRHDERIGKTISSEKFFSRFYSRYIVYRRMIFLSNYNKNNEFYLLNEMTQALKCAVRSKFDSAILKISLRMLLLIIYSKFKFRILKLIFISVPIYRFSGKGERLF